jgi:uncharacterized cupin superfamily protein
VDKQPREKVRVIKPDDVVWTQAAVGPEEAEPAGAEFTAFEAGQFSTGFWQRDLQSRRFVRPYHEIAYIIEGEVELTMDDGTVIHAGPGDILVTPKGSEGHWRNLSPVKKFWAIYEE